jgi:PAT family beta-lactamase induction signal transducer AmpG
MMVAAIVTENITSGIGLTVFATYLSGLSSVAYTATQFALLSSLAGVGRTFMAGPAGWVAEKIGWFGFWGFTIVAAIPGMIFLWLLWSKGYVGEGIRQSTTIDETKLKEPVGALRILGFLMIIAGLVGVLLSQQLKLESMWLYASLAGFAVGMALAWKRKALA